MWWALLNDIIQRIVTLNKHEQKVYLHARLQRLNLPRGSKALDFGCGTGLFVDVFKKNGFSYYGYDIDRRLCDYGNRIYKDAMFTASRELLREKGPFDLIVANCCFHHIDDASLPAELAGIRDLLSVRGVLLVIDLLTPDTARRGLNKMYGKIEQGEHLRSRQQYQAMLGPFFTIEHAEERRTYPFSLPNNLVFNRQAVFQAVLKGGTVHGQAAG